ncbi:MAG: 2,3,4,5-tetrahydropyridine-2,6-dicarboxylate N-acetyltransferase [Parabacteroides sp.]
MKVLFKKILHFIMSVKYAKKVTLLDDSVRFYRTTHVNLIEGATPRNIILSPHVQIYCTLTSCKNGVIKFGSYSKIGPGSKVLSVNRIEVGAYTAIARNVTICDNNNHPINPIDRKIMRATPEGSFERSWTNSENKPIIIGENVWIGENSRICKGVNIGENSIIAANSVVTKDIPANSVAAGNPAKIVKTDIDKITSPRFSTDRNISI